MFRNLFAIATIVMGVAWILAFLLVVRVQFAPAAATTNSGNEIAVVERFYDAVNSAIETGELDAVNATLHSDLFYNEEAMCTANELEVVAAQIAQIRESNPNARLEIRSIAGSGSEVVVQASLTETPADPVLGINRSDSATYWPAVERFRVMGNVVAERTYSSGILTETIEDRTFDAELGVESYALVRGEQLNMRHGGRLTIRPGTLGAYLIPLGDGLQIAGSAGIEPIDVFRSENAGMANAELLLQDTDTPNDLLAGSLVFLPEWQNVTLTNSSARDVTLLLITFSSPLTGVLNESGIPQYRTGGEFRGSHETVSLWNWSFTGGVGQLWSVGIGRVAVLPGAKADVHPATELLIAISPMGEVRMLSDETSGKPSKVTVYEVQAQETETAVEPFLDHTMAPATSVLSNTGPEVATAWLIAITPRN